MDVIFQIFFFLCVSWRNPPSHPSVFFIYTRMYKNVFFEDCYLTGNQFIFVRDKNNAHLVVLFCGTLWRNREPPVRQRHHRSPFTCRQKVANHLPFCAWLSRLFFATEGEMVGGTWLGSVPSRFIIIICLTHHQTKFSYQSCSNFNCFSETIWKHYRSS